MSEPRTLSFSVQESIDTDDGLDTGGGITHYRKAGGLYSVYPPYGYLTLGPWIYLCPPFKPTDMLMLGYSGGTVAGLVQSIFGKDVKITAVDHSIVDNRYKEVELVKADAREFVKVSRTYDFVLVDLFDEEQTCPFIWESDFIDHIVRITRKFLIVHASDDSPIEETYGKRFGRQRLLNIGNHKIYYYLAPECRENFFPPVYSFKA